MKKLVVIILSVLMVLGLVACGNKDEEDNKGNNIGKGFGIVDNSEDWGINFNGNKVKLPCTLEELEKVGVYLYYENFSNELINTANEEFFGELAVYEDEANGFVYLDIKTGNDCNKGKENILVTGVAVTDSVDGFPAMEKEYFSIKNGLGFGDNIEDVIKEYGEDFKVEQGSIENLQEGFVSIRYGTEEEGYLFLAQDGDFLYIGVTVDVE